MLFPIADVLNPEQVAAAREALAKAEWIDGKATAGYQSAKAKDNMQLPQDHPVARQVGEMILAALGRNPLFMAAALPLHVYPPMFNRYSGGQQFGTHVDNAIRADPRDGATASAPTSPRRSSSPVPKSTTGASW